MAELSEEMFRGFLEKKGLHLEGKAFDVALEGARHLRREAERVRQLLEEQRDRPA